MTGNWAHHGIISLGRFARHLGCEEGLPKIRGQRECCARSTALLLAAFWSERWVVAPGLSLWMLMNDIFKDATPPKVALPHWVDFTQTVTECGDIKVLALCKKNILHSEKCSHSPASHCAKHILHLENHSSHDLMWTSGSAQWLKQTKTYFWKGSWNTF